MHSTTMYNYLKEIKNLEKNLAKKKIKGRGYIPLKL